MKALKELFAIVCGCIIAGAAIYAGVQLGWW